MSKMTKSESIAIMAVCCVATASAWISQPTRFLSNPVLMSTSAQQQRRSLALNSAVVNRSGRKPSRVSDPDGPTPSLEEDDIEEVDVDDLNGMKEITAAEDLPRPIPHQPWRRGEMDGCDAPIDEDWRQSAESIIYSSAKLVGAEVLDVTWFLTSVVVTIDENMTVEQRDLFKAEGPVINLEIPKGPTYHDPNDPNPDDVSADPEEILYQRETEEEHEEYKIREETKWATKDPDDPEDEPHNPLKQHEPKISLFKNEETRPDVALRGIQDEQTRAREMEKPVDIDALPKIDTAALSTIAGVILEALGEVEDELRILERHEVILASPGADDVLETQKQFNAFRGERVIVETQDPFESNRILKGRLVDRNSMDVYINQKGRLVTIPNCFVKCVRIPFTGDEEGEYEYEEEE